jgi:ribonucleoside-diphosphate reductase alpha chain
MEKYTNMKLASYNPKGFSLQIFKDRYSLFKDESFQEACRRVANFIASAEDGEKIKEFETRFFDIMSTNRFSPGGRIWRGANRKKPAMMNCFVLPSEDSREGWGELLKNVTIISGLGGGIGISFDNIRPRGTEIKGTGGIATGAVSLMKIVNGVCNELREGGGRRSALLFGLSYWHPDIEEFLNVKLDKKELNNANISILVDNKFFDLVESDGDIELKWQDKIIKTIKAKWLYDKVIENSLQTGDPGFLNLGLAKEMNNLWYCREQTVCNPCAEQVLPPYSVCCLGAIILSTHIKENGEIDWSLLDDTIRLGIRFLDNVIDKNEYPLEIIKEISQKERRLGLGIMGLHDMFLKMGIKYSSQEALETTDKVMLFIKKKAYEASIFLAVEKSQFSLLDRYKFIESGFCKKSLTPALRKKILEYGIRNCFLLTIAPTGTTSIVAGCSSGIEPMFAPVYKRNFNKHKDIHTNISNQSSEIIIHPLLKEFIELGKDYSHFEGAHEISPEQHCKIQEMCQKHICNAVSKTINLPEKTTEKELSNIMIKYIRNLKGMTIYRDKSKGESPVMPLPTKEAKKYLNECLVQSTDNGCVSGKCDI